MASSFPPAFGAELAQTRAIIDLAQLRHNLQRLRGIAGTAPIMAVVKADAYGHGAVPIARTLAQNGVERFAVATVTEAIRLREAGFGARILVFAAPLPELLPAYFEYGLDVTISSPEVADAVIQSAQVRGPLRAHLKVETGMGRIGVMPDDAPDVIRRLQASSDIELEGIWTHFASAAEPGAHTARAQLERFETVLAAVGGFDGFVHAAASDAILNVPASVGAFRRTLIRSGISLYGYGRSDLAEEAGVLPIMRLSSRVTHLKTVAAGTPISYGGTWVAPTRRRIATVGAGYADGYPRLLSNRGAVRIGGHRYPIAGIVCMDMFMVDLGPADSSGATVAVGDEVVLFGPKGPTAREVAEWAETIPYEICCGIGPRVARHYIDEDPRPSDAH